MYKEHKVLLLLGLLHHRPLSSYELHQIVLAHGSLYADLKKANIYYLLSRLAAEGLLEVRAEPGARGPRRERLIYRLTTEGRAQFRELLRKILQHYEPVHTGVGTAIVFLAGLSPSEGLALLNERRQVVARRRAEIGAELGDLASQESLAGIAADHLLTLIDAELAWMDRVLARLHTSGWAAESENHLRRTTLPGEHLEPWRAASEEEDPS